jgi:hypothetical protein
MPRPPQTLSITYPLLSRHSLWSSIAGAAVPTASAPWAAAGDLGVVEAKPSTCLFGQTIFALSVTADQSPGETKLAVLFPYSLEKMLFEKIGQVQIIADGMQVNLGHCP